jgi:hypothetical protein
MGVFLPFMNVSAQEYFQQQVNYKIEVSLNDRKHELNGFETIEYINNSPDRLDSLYFHLWPNAYSDNKTELATQIFSLKGKEKLFRDPILRGYIDSLDFEADGQKIKWNLLPGLCDICTLILNAPLEHGDTIYITTPFHVKIPKGVTSRLGHIDESYQISQWYPKPAVYDRSGWHQMPYLDQGEFYSEFGNYDVSITLPANYIVGATGNLQNEQENEEMERLSADSSWINIPEKRVADFPTSSKRLKTLRFTGDKIHDFAWFADKRFHVKKSKVKLADSGREITTWVLFTDKDSFKWDDAISYINSAVLQLSKWIGDYPYDSFTAVQSELSSGSGMEYPGLAVINNEEDTYLLDEVLVHEICHNWFYSALGSDERRYPFMDESITSAYESRYMAERYPKKKLWEVYFRNKNLAKFLNIYDMPVQRMQEIEWFLQARANLEQPVNLSAPDYSQTNYSTVIYDKAAQGFNYLRAYLGDSLFDTIMHDYFRTWKYKHPQPDDLQNIFASHTDKDLSWFFNDFLKTTKRLDYKIARVSNQKVLIKNIGELDAPLVITEMIGDSICSKKWENGFKGEKWFDIMPGNYSEIRIDPEHKMTELYRLNNNIRTSGIFRKKDPVQFQLLYTIDDPDRRALVYFPAFDWNSTDGFMVGMSFKNSILITKKIEYIVIPFYSFRNHGLTGFGNISFNFTPFDSFVRMAKFSLEGVQFGAPGNQNYHKVKIGLELDFRSLDIINSLSNKVFVYYVAASDLLQIEQLNDAKMRSYLLTGYMRENPSKINPYRIVASFESGKSYNKISFELNYELSYNGLNNGLEIRLFGGSMFMNKSADPVFCFSPGGRSGREQYLYNGAFPDRFSEFPKTFWSRQMTLSEGGLVAYVNDSLGYGRWLCSLSFVSSLPGKTSVIPIKPFLNLLVNNPVSDGYTKSYFYFEAGLETGIWNFFEIYLPLLVSDKIDATTGSFKNRIRFVFSLDKLIR